MKRMLLLAMCVALVKDLRSDPLVRRGERCASALENAVDFGTQNYGDQFFVPVKPHPSSGFPQVPTAAEANGTSGPATTRKGPAAT